MVTLNLTANGKEQEKIKAYLQNNVSATLAAKINDGVKIEKDGKQLISKKDLTTFMQYAEEQVLQLIAENERNGRQVRCIDDAAVYGWAIHYFEEDSIEGKLFNTDGTPYEPPKPVKKVTQHSAITNPYVPPKPQPKPQLNIFDMLSGNDEQAEEPNVEPAVTEQPKPEPQKGSPMYQHYLKIKEKYNDCIVFYKLGDFYEMFGDDAVIAARELDLTLTGRDCGLDERVPMTGIPYHAVDKYIPKLVANNHKVAVCELLNGEIDVERVITKQPEDNRLVDIKTGEIISDEIEELSVDEMRKFDGDIDEPEELITVSKLIGEGNDDEQPATANDAFDFTQEREMIKAFDVETVCILQDLLEDKITLV